MCAGGSLAYFANEKSREPLRVIDMRKCTAVLEASFEKSGFGIEVVLPERTFMAYCDNKEERAEWIKHLREVMARAY